MRLLKGITIPNHKNQITIKKTNFKVQRTILNIQDFTSKNLTLKKIPAFAGNKYETRLRHPQQK